MSCLNLYIYSIAVKKSLLCPHAEEDAKAGNVGIVAADNAELQA